MKDGVLSGRQRKFCEGVVSGMLHGEAYAAAYPGAKSAEGAVNSASRLMAMPRIREEIGAMRAKADLLAGSAVMTLVEKRSFLARVVRAQVALLERDSDLWQSVKETEAGTEFRLPGKLEAIRLDNDLAGEGSEAGANDALAELLERVRR